MIRFALVMMAHLAWGQGEWLDEHERCARALVEANDRGFDRRASAIVRAGRHVDEAMARLRRGGGLTDDQMAGRLDAKLRFGAVFAREGLVHEAMHQALTARFETPAAIAAALRNFRHLDDPKAKGRLIAEVTERVLQFVPDVDAAALSTLDARAAFVNLATTELIEFRDRWRVHDAREEFVEMLGDAVGALLEGADEALFADVRARDTRPRRSVRQALNLASRPEPLDERVTARDVALEDRAYFDARDVTSYLAASSPAARAFFVGHWRAYLGVGLLGHAFERRDEWGFKPSLVRAILTEIQRRRAAAGRINRRDEIRREHAATERALRELYPRGRDARLRLDAIGALWQIADPTEAARAGDRVIERVEESGSAAEFVNTVVSVRDAILSRLRGRTGLIAEFVTSTVERANRVGLDEGQRQKVERVLTDVVQLLPARAAKAPRAEIARLTSARRDRAAGDPARLRRRATELSLALRTLERELEDEWGDR